MPTEPEFNYRCTLTNTLLGTPVQTFVGHLNALGYQSIVADHPHSLLTTVSTSSDGYIRQDNALFCKIQIDSNWFLEHWTEFTVLQWPPHSPHINPKEHFWDMVEQSYQSHPGSATGSCQYGPKISEASLCLIVHLQLVSFGERLWCMCPKVVYT